MDDLRKIPFYVNLLTENTVHREYAVKKQFFFFSVNFNIHDTDPMSTVCDLAVGSDFSIRRICNKINRCILRDIFPTI